jgi:hypothetical protein
VQAKYLLKVQKIRSRRQPERYYVNIPLPLAAAMGLEGGEAVQWQLVSRRELRLVRTRTASRAPGPKR